MTKNLFGTDGIRGVPNSGSLEPDNILKIAIATAGVLGSTGRHNKVLIGKDTRLSGYLLENALTAGFIASGTDVFLVGPMPTPGISMLTKSLRADLGIMISASHNPYQDNGIKIFGGDGYKISDDMQAEISRKVLNGSWKNYFATPDNLGKAKRIEDAQGRYIEFVKNTFPKGLSLNGLRVVLDCANGATYHIGPTILWELGAEVITIANTPDGYNINEKCGATHPELLIENVKKLRADIGIALDGDGDRVLIVDEKGHVIDGDQILTLIASYWKKTGILKQNTVISTVMANKAMEDYLNKININVIRTQVGDRYVMQAMQENSVNLGGEQSGHIIMSDYATTGDGLIAALQVLAVVAEQKKPASEICRVFKPYPQICKNVKFKNSNPLEKEEIKVFINSVQTTNSSNARILVRKSGTEPLIRIMVEGKDSNLINNLANEIEEKISLA
ncbi:MAG: phosphoglucosamine mutase [Sphingobacteriia bacterium]|nr:phosphoglucosamine mutase [Sphingobacteriia bacterium]